MSFSSAEWTIPELCVWIETRNARTVSGLPPGAQDVLQYMAHYCPAAYGRRDEIIQAGQEGAVTVAGPGGRPLLQSSWNNAEIEDTFAFGAARCVVSSGQAILSVRPRVSRAVALERWGERHAQVGLTPKDGEQLVSHSTTSWDADYPPPQFHQWVTECLSRRQPISQTNAVAWAGTLLAPKPGRDMVNRWVRSLPDTQRTRDGETVVAATKRIWGKSPD